MHFKQLFTISFLLISFTNFADSNTKKSRNTNKPDNIDSIAYSIDYLKKRLQTNEIWQVENPKVTQSLTGLIHYAEDLHIDSVLFHLNEFQQDTNFRYINRLPSKVGDSLNIRGYLPYPSILEEMKKLNREIWNGVDMNSIPIPPNLRINPLYEQLPIAPGNEQEIIHRTKVVLPDSLNNVNANPKSNSPNNFDRIKKRQEARARILEEARLKYNSNLDQINRDTAIVAYRKYAVRVFSDSLQNHLRDSLKTKNLNILTHYNDSIVSLVNDTINRYVQTLQQYAQKDSIPINIYTLTGGPTQVWLKNYRHDISRMYIKNVQNDSLGIQLMNIDKNTLGIAIEDNVTFDRIAKKQSRELKFDQIKPDQKLTTIKKKYDVVVPWEYGGIGALGFTQTYLNNWKAGGKSAFSLLMVLKGYVYYTNDKLKWENFGEIRNGWIRQGSDVDQTQKNDDKLELISRLGLVSNKKDWYYSAEVDFLTQFFNGYNYPDKSVAISSFMAPAKTMFKLGFDYKPKPNFSLFLSPFTAKYVSVRDTAKVDQTRYGVPEDKKRFWEPGFNTDFRYKMNITPTITYETKYKMFVNYQNPLKNLDIYWENNVIAQLTDRINMTLMLYLLYDDNVTFPTGEMDAEGKEIYKAKLQTKELFTIGFAYKINKHVYSRKKLN
jgi:hypothetical protein